MVTQILSIFVLISLFLSLGLYITEMISQLATDSVLLTKSAYTTLDQTFDLEKMATDVLEVYKSIPEEVRKDQKSDEYRAYFKDLERDSKYQMLELVLGQFRDSSNVSDVYMEVFDPETETTVYFAEPDRSEYRVWIGQYEEVDQKYVKKLMDSSMETPFHAFFPEGDSIVMTSGIMLDTNKDIQIALLADTDIKHIVKKSGQFALFYIIFISAIGFVIGLFATKMVKKGIVLPINMLAEAAKVYVSDKKEGSDNKNHFENLNIDTGDELEILYYMMTDMEKDLNDYEKNLKSITAERERIGAEIEIATAIQQGMLENVAPNFVGKKEYDLYAAMTPAREVGGDFYDFFMVDDDHLAILIADVSDKGVGSAFFMAISKTLVKTYAKMVMSPTDVISKVDKQISEKNDAGLFVTLWMAVIDLNTGHVTACNAGHDYPAIMKKGEDFVIEKTPHGPPVAFIPGMEFEGTEFDMKPGDRIFLYTDGLNEAKRSDDERFGTGRMLEVLNAHKDVDNETMIQLMREAVEEFAGDEPQFDDMTMLGFTFKGR
jgi:sigma-B regulation protein RsbU (phosphoserine phosphatase)